MSSWSTSASRGLWRSGDQWIFSSGLSHSGPSESANPSCGYFLFQNASLGWILSSWQNPHSDFLTYGMRRTTVEKSRWKPLVLPLPRKTVNQKQYCIPGGTAEISATIKDLKDAGLVVPTTSHSTHLSGLHRKQIDLGNDSELL